MNESQEMIVELHKRWGQHEVDCDLEGWLELVDDNVILQPPGAPQVTGKKAAAEFVSAFSSLPIAKMEVGESTVVLSELEDMALITGPIRLALDDPQKGYTEEDLKYMAVWVKVGASWKVRSNSWSSDA